MRLVTVALSSMFLTLFASSAQAQLRHVEMKTLGMD
jgi:hypothetical protein